MISVFENKLNHAGMERGVICGVITYGQEIYFEISDIISEHDFYFDLNRNLFILLKYLNPLKVPFGCGR